MRKELATECPVCGFLLKGDRFAGYRCVKCHALFSARFVAQLRRKALKSMISDHFDATHTTSTSGDPPVRIERSDVIIEDKEGRVEQTLKEAKEAARNAAAHLQALHDAAQRRTVAPPDPQVPRAPAPKPIITPRIREVVEDEMKAELSSLEALADQVRTARPPALPHPSLMMSADHEERIELEPKKQAPAATPVLSQRAAAGPRTPSGIPSPKSTRDPSKSPKPAQAPGVQVPKPSDKRVPVPRSSSAKEAKKGSEEKESAPAAPAHPKKPAGLRFVRRARSGRR